MITAKTLMAYFETKKEISLEGAVFNTIERLEGWSGFRPAWIQVVNDVVSRYKFDRE